MISSSPGFLLLAVLAVGPAVAEPLPIAILDHVAQSPGWIPLDEQMARAFAAAKGSCRDLTGPECVVMRHIAEHQRHLEADLKGGRPAAVRAFVARHIAHVLEDPETYLFGGVWPLHETLGALAPVFRRCPTAFSEAGQPAGLSPSSMLRDCGAVYCAVVAAGPGCTAKLAAWPVTEATAEAAWSQLMVAALRHEVAADASQALGRMLESRRERLFTRPLRAIETACSEPDEGWPEGAGLRVAEACVASGKGDVALRVVRSIMRQPHPSAQAYAALTALLSDGSERRAAVVQGLARAQRDASLSEWLSDQGPWSPYADPDGLREVAALNLTSPSPWSWRPLDERVDKTVAALNAWCVANPKACGAKAMVTFNATGARATTEPQRLAVLHASRRLLDAALQDGLHARTRLESTLRCPGAGERTWDWEEELATSLCPFDFKSKPAQKGERSRLELSLGAWKVTVALRFTLADQWAHDPTAHFEAAHPSAKPQ